MDADMDADTNAHPDTPPEDSPDQPTRLSEEDARRLVEQLRSAPAEHIVAEVLSTLLTAADAKLGRRDARLFIDLCATVSGYAGPYVSGELRTQVEKALGQLRLAQVSAEGRAAGNGEPEPNDLDRLPTPPAAAGRHAPAGERPAESPASRLWVPGR